MKHILLAIAGFILVVAIVFTWVYVSSKGNDKTVEALPYADVIPGDWCYEYVRTAVEHGWLKANEGDQFLPDQPMTRGEVSLVLYRYLGTPSIAGFRNPYVDISQAEYQHAVTYLHKLGVIIGEDDTHFAPEELISREETVTILYRLGGYKVHEEFSPGGKFMDWERTSAWARDAVDWAVECGLLMGTADNILGPMTSITRGRFIKLLCLYAEKANYKTDTFDPQRSTTLQVWQLGVDDTETALAMEQLLRTYEKRNAGATVKYTPFPSGNKVFYAVAEQIRKGNAPDVLILSSPYEMLLADHGDILPLETLLSKDVLADLQTGLLGDCYYRRDQNPELRARLVSVPITASPTALLVNKSIFQHFNVSYPSGGYSYSQLIFDAQNLTGTKDGKVIYGYGARGSSADLYLNMVRSRGGNILDPRDWTVACGDEIWEEVTGVYAGLYEEAATPDYHTTMDSYSLLELFHGGTVAMMSGSLETAKMLQGTSEWKENLYVYPYANNAQATSLSVGQVAVIPSITTHVVDAACLIDYLLETGSQLAYTGKTENLPAVKSALNLDELKNDAYYQPYIRGLEEAHRLGERGHKVYALICDKLQSYLRGELDLQSYCASLSEEISVLLGKQTE